MNLDRCTYMLIFIWTIFKYITCASAPVTWSTGNYFLTGTFSYVPTTTGYFYKTVTVTYVKNLTGTPSQNAVVGLTSFNFNMRKQIYFYLKVTESISKTGFSVYVQSDYGSDISNLLIGYLVVDPSFPHPFSVGFIVDASVWKTAPFTNYHTQVDFTYSTGVVLNMSNKNVALAFLTFFWAESNTYCYDFKVDYYVKNKNIYAVDLSSYCKGTYIDGFGISRMLFDQTAIQNLGKCYFTYGTLVSTNGNYAPFIFDTNPFDTKTFIVGLQMFNTSGQTRLDFLASIGNTTSISGTSNFTYMSFHYWTFKIRVCPAGTPFFYLQTELCYDVCPDGTYGNTTTYLCLPCNYTCLNCSAFNVCTSCNTTLNRYQNDTTCPASPGYFDNGTSDTILCSSVLANCQTCSSAAICKTCSTGYYLTSNKTCKPCDAIANCLKCALSGSTLKCSQCHPLLTMGPSNLSCLAPNCNVSYCTVCQNFSADSCRFCNDGYHLYNDTNITGGCETQCGDNITAGTEECDNGNNSDGDGCNADCTFGNSNGCPATNPFRDPSTNLCSSTCPNPYFKDTSTFDCQECYYTCGSCSNATSCDSCLNQSNRFLNGTQCSPSPGFYDNSTLDAVPCQSPCIQCISEIDCLNCVLGYYLSGTTCIRCLFILSNCVDCDNSTYCINCSLGYFVNITTGQCDKNPCRDQNCFLCPEEETYCTLCVSGYKNNSGNCVPICGDFIKQAEEGCDDNNTQSGDGCSSLCVVEENFTCELNQEDPPGSICYYIGNITINQIYINKIENKNQIQILLEITPNNVPLLNHLNPQDIIQLQTQVPIKDYQIVKNSNGTYTLRINYNGDIQGKPINLIVNPALSNFTLFSKMNDSSLKMIINPVNNQGAYFYDDSTYSLADMVSKVSTGVSGLSLAVFMASIISGKMVGVEMMAVLQVTFFSLITLSQMNPCYAALSSLWLVNGYNSLNKNNLSDKFTPIPLKGIKMFSRYTQNFNFTAALILIPLITALVSFILSKTAFKGNAKVEKIAKHSLGEYTLMGLMFGGYLISISSTLELMYGRKNLADLIGKVSCVECTILLLLFIGYFVFLIMKSDFFGQFTNSFKKDVLSSKFYNFMIFQRLLVGSGLVLLLNIKMAGAAFSIGAFLLIGVYIVLKGPYKQNYHNLRQIANMAISILIISIFLSYSALSPSATNKSKIFFYLPLIVLALLALCVIYNGAVIAYSIYKFIKGMSAKDLDYLEKQQLEELNKHRKFSSPLTICQTSQYSQQSPSLRSKQSPTSPTQIRTTLKIEQIKRSIKLNLINPSSSGSSGYEQLKIFSLEQKSSEEEKIHQYDAL